MAIEDKIRIAVLGGGPAALAAAYALSEKGGYKITVYQMGWRLGGKCATGRRLDDGRHFEHGLHVLGGFYHNAMGLLRRAYEAWPGCSEYAISFEEAFIGHDTVHIMENGPAGAFPVRFPFPANSDPLGRKPKDLNLRTVAEQLLKYVWEMVKGGLPLRGAAYAADDEFREALGYAVQSLSPAAMRAMSAGDTAQVGVVAIENVLAIVQGAGLLPTPAPKEAEPDYGILFEILLVVARGFVADGLWRKGFDAANHLEFTTWMTGHGLSERARRSAYFRCGYDYAFAYENGAPDRPMMAAGVGLRGFLRMVFTYNTSVFVHMDGGMGEVIFTPLYEVMRSRGVEFKFFHRIDRLELDDAGVRVRRIEGTVQNQPIAEWYDPLCLYKPPGGSTRAVWPDRPIAERLGSPLCDVERPEFRYESPWHAPPDAKPFALIADEDFDLCILGIPVAALHSICADLAQKIPDWKNMLEHSVTTPTLAAQLWQASTTSKLGWSHGATVLTANAPPHSSWADMSYLLPLEETKSSRHLSYFCGPVETAFYTASPYDSDYGPPELQRGDDRTRQWCDEHLGQLLPGAVIPAARAPGAADELYVRLNSFPSELYVLTKPGKVHFRLTPGGSFVQNLFLAGDWTRNGYDIGSFETAVLSGLICASAVAGDPTAFPGDRDRAW